VSAGAPLRLLFDAHQLGRRQTGNETYVRALLHEFRHRSDLEVTALVEEAAREDEAVASFERRTVPRSGTLRLAAMGLIGRQVRPSVLHAIYFAPYLAGCPVVLTIHDISYEIHPEFFSRAERLRGRTLIRDGARRARVVVTVSETSRRDIIERYGVPEDRVVAIHNGVSQRFLDAPPRDLGPIGDRPVTVLAVGTLQPRKNLGRLLEAVARAATRRPIRLRVVGPDGYQADAIRSRLADSADVDIAGYVSDDALLDEYRRADMLVYPSLYEGFGLPVVEAMAAGTPVITSTSGSLPEVAGDAALLIDPLDVGAIADAILRLAEDESLRRDLVTKGMERAQRFSWAASADRHVEVYRHAAEG
jgi:glycosyltransferase involved in cell wall biosynthesis